MWRNNIPLLQQKNVIKTQGKSFDKPTAESAVWKAARGGVQKMPTKSGGQLSKGKDPKSSDTQAAGSESSDTAATAIGTLHASSCTQQPAQATQHQLFQRRR